MHAAAFPRARMAYEGAALQPLFRGSAKALWLCDSTPLLLVAAILTVLAVRPSAATRPVVVLVALVPAAIAFLIYQFLGPFFAGHMLVLAAGAALLAVWGLPVGTAEARLLP